MGWAAEVSPLAWVVPAEVLYPPLLATVRRLAPLGRRQPRLPRPARLRLLATLPPRLDLRQPHLPRLPPAAPLPPPSLKHHSRPLLTANHSSASASVAVVYPSALAVPVEVLWALPPAFNRKQSDEKASSATVIRPLIISPR